MAEGLGEFVEAAGFRAEFEIKPIVEEETCDCLDPEGPDWQTCAKKAKYAKYMLDISLFCTEHAAEVTNNKGGV